MTLARRLILCCVVLCCGLHLVAQRAIVSNQAADLSSISTNNNSNETTNAAGTVSSRVISFSDTLDGQPDGALTVTFALYPDQQSATALWTETQLVQVTDGKYTALLGSTTTQGIPESAFAADQAHWLGVQANGTEKRLLLVSVPYAIKAMEADRLGGLLPSQYVTTAQLQTILQNSAAAMPATTTPRPTSNSAIQTAAAVGTTPQPATDFTDNNDSEVLLVTQQGTGYAIHAISGLQPAIYAENNNITGTAMEIVATSTTGANTGLLARTLSSGGVAGIFDSAGPQILVLRSNGVQVMTFDQFGDITANGQVQANNFVGGGFGLTNIPNSATTATSANSNNTIVARDQFGGFSASQVQASNFVGAGFGLTNIPPAAVGATSLNTANSVVARDGFGNFAAGQIQASNFVGGGLGLSNIPNSATTATDANTPGAIVARDANGGFLASTIQVQQSFISSGITDFSNANSTAPVKSVLSVNTPTTCMASKELLIKTDAPAGQQLFICNANGNDWILLGDGSAASGIVSGNTTGPLESITQLGSGAGVTVSSFSGTGLNAASTNGTALSASSANQIAIQATGNSIGVQASSRAGIGLWAAAQATDSSGTSLLLTNSGSGKLISGGQSDFSFLQFETFGVDTLGNVNFNGALMSAYEPSGFWVPNSLVKLTSSSGVFASATVTVTSPGDRSGAIGIITGIQDGNFVLVAQGGRQDCVFDGTPQMGDYVGISQLQSGQCTDLGPAYPTNGGQVIGRVTLSSASPLGTVLLFGPDQHASTAGGLSSLSAADSSVLIGGTSIAPTVEVASGGITSDKLAPNAVTSVNIADGSLSAAKISGTAATLGSNTFTAAQTMPSLNVQGQVNAGAITGSSLSATNGGFFGGPTSVSTATGTALSISGGDSTSPGMKATSFYHALDASSTSSYGVFATSSSGFGVHAEGNAGGIEVLSHSVTGPGIRATVTGTAATAGDFDNESATGFIITGRAQGSLMFNLDVSGNASLAGAHTGIYTNSPAGTTPLGLAKIDVNGQAVSTSAGDVGGAIGVVTSGAGTSGPVSIAYAGKAWCLFDNAVQTGDYVQISRAKAAYCTDAGPAYPTSGQVIGRVLAPGGVASSWILLFGPEQRAVPGGTITSINTGTGLVGGPITSSGTISIANAGVTNSMLQHSSLTVVPGTGLSGGGVVPLGGSITLNNTGALSFNGRSGAVVSASGDYSFAQIAGTASTTQLPPTSVYSNQSNNFLADQTINGALTANSLTTGTLASGSGSVSGTATPTTPVFSVSDGSAVFGNVALFASSQTNTAASFLSGGPSILNAGTPTHAVFGVTATGINVSGTATATSFAGDGSALANINASTLGGVSVTDLATNTALNAETAARQSADSTVQTNLSAETTARQSDVANLQSGLTAETTARAAGDASLQTSINGETTARQSDVANLQSSINNLSAADAKLAASNTFTAGTQDFSGAGATLPVRSVLTANTPATCVAGKELIIKTDAPAGQQLFICDASGTNWDLVGDGAAGGVTSFNGRNGTVAPATNDYSFSQISGSLADSQMPAFTGDVTTTAGSSITVLAPTGVASGSYSKVTVDPKGRVTSGAQASFADLAGSVSQTQLPVFTVFNNQVNTFSASQTVNGTLTANLFNGNGSSLSNVNAATLNGFPSSAFAQLSGVNTFNGEQVLSASNTANASLNMPAGSAPATPLPGDIWNTGSTLQYSDSSSNTQSLVSTPQSTGMQLLKLTASVTPATVSAQVCTEQSFTVTGLNATDLLLAVAQPSTRSPGTNIAIGGWRVSAANTVAIQFCNVSRSNNTPTAGIYTFALMR